MKYGIFFYENSVPDDFGISLSEHETLNDAVAAIPASIYGKSVLVERTTGQAETEYAEV